MRWPILTASVVGALLLAAPTASAAISTYEGTHRDYDYGECSGDPCDSFPAAARLETSGNDFTLYYFENGTIGDHTACGSFETDCTRYTGTISGASLSGTGVRDDSPSYTDLDFSATLDGESLDGTAFWQNDCPDGGCYWEFTLTRTGTDAVPPEVIIESAPSGADNGPDATVRFSSTKPVGAAFSCTLDSEPERGCSSPLILPDLAVGPHTLRITTTDTDGIVSAPVTVSWSVAPEPIIFIHGFLGARIVCGGQEAWPNIPPLPRLLEMRLMPDGLTDLTGGCSVPAFGGLVETAGIDVYGSTVAFLREAAPERFHVYAWDWRKSPEQALQGLDDLVDQVRRPDGGKVVLMAHSKGGLVTRWYIDDPARADKVARAVTIGTPYWGSPKALFPLAAGVEVPSFSALDALFDNDDLQAFAVNLQGMYHLWPSDRYGRWLTVDGRLLDRPALLTYVLQDLGGNSALLQRALDDHALRLDDLRMNGVDYQIVVGTGVQTIGAVEIDPLIGGLGLYTIDWQNGDGTVPRHSGRLGGGVPADRLHYTCGVGHVPLPGHPQVTNRIRDFLLEGKPITGPQEDCPAEGFELQTFVLGLGGIAASVERAQAAGGPLTLDQAERQGMIERLDLGRQQVIATNASMPVTVKLSGRGVALKLTRLADGRKGTPAYYRPVAGEVVVDLARSAVLTRGGRPLKPLRRADRRPPRTRVGVRLRGRRALLRFRATDASGVAATYVEIGSRPARRVDGSLRVRRSVLRRVRFRSVDVFGNVERRRRLRLRSPRSP